MARSSSRLLKKGPGAAESEEPRILSMSRPCTQEVTTHRRLHSGSSSVKTLNNFKLM